MGFFDSLAQCKPCSQSDPTQDTVKVDTALLAGGKENVEPLAFSPNSQLQAFDEKDEIERKQKEQEMQEAEQEMLRQAEAEAAEERRRAEEEARKRKEDAARAVAEAAARQQAEKVAQEKHRLAQEQAALEAARKAEDEEKRKTEEARLRKEEEELREAQAKVNAWCKANGYANMNTEKKKLFGASKLPLHEAVAKKDLQLVQSLVKCGVDKCAKNSKGQTASDLARNINKNGSMNEFLVNLA